MYANDHIDNLIEKPEKMEESQREILFGGLTENYKYADNYVYKTLPEGHRSAYKIGEYQEIFDPGSDCPEPLIFVYQFYGKDILLRLRKELKGFKEPASGEAKNFISDELHQEMKKIYDVKRPPNKQKPAKSNSDKPVASQNDRPKLKLKKSLIPVTNSHDEKYFHKTNRKLIRNKKYRKVFKGPGTVWDWLWSKIIRWGWIDTKGYPLKEKFFDNHLLVCSYSISKIAEKCGMAKGTVSKYLKMFEEEGVIRIEHLERKGKKRGQSVYIIGEWRDVDGEHKEFLYRDTAFD